MIVIKSSGLITKTVYGIVKTITSLLSVKKE